MSTFSRRQFLVTAGAALGATSLLSACGGPVVASECAGYDTLTEAQLRQREALGYVDQTPRAAQVCSNCKFYNAPEGSAACGGCQLFPGPVAPQGWCSGWVANA